jgi:penicillin amidase
MLRGLFRLLLGAREPIVEGRVRVTGSKGPIVLRRDRHGVAYVEAQNDHDAYFGLGFCQAQDRAFQLELLLRVSQGTLSEIVGAEMLDTDRLSRRIGFTRIAAAQLAACDERTQEQLHAFARGVNEGMQRGRTKRPHELALLRADPTPFRPSDSLAIVQFLAFGLSSNWDAELVRLRVLRADGAAALLRLEASPDGWRVDLEGVDRALSDVDLLHAAEGFAAGLAGLRAHGVTSGASNNWVVAGSRTVTGRPLLANDPHLGPSLPAPWYLAHVRAPGWAMSGAFLPGQPTASIGHGEHGAWGVTAGHADNTDLFVERLGPDGASVLEGDRYVRCEARTETIRVKGKPDVVERVLVTPRGPIVGPALGESRDALSMRATWMAARPVGGYQLHRARTVDEMRACFASYPAVSENRVFADVSGSIAWQMTGDLPVRGKASGLLPAPGWDRSAGWEPELRPFETLPHERDPERGWLASANQRPAALDAPGAPFLGADWLDSYRYDRIAALLAVRSDWTVRAFQTMQLDRQSRLWPEVRDAFLAAARGGEARDLAVARRLLEVWDGQVAPDSAAASVFELALSDIGKRVARAVAPKSWEQALGTPLNEVLTHGTMALRRLSHLSRLIREQPAGVFAAGWETELGSALASAVAQLESHFGSNERSWAWGAVRPLRLRHPVGKTPPLDRIFGLRAIAVGGDATTIPQASVDFHDPLGDPIGIANLRTVMDVGAWENSRWSLAGGQSENPCSRHFGDLLPLWERGDGIAIEWTRDDIVRAAVATLVLENE